MTTPATPKADKPVTGYSLLATDTSQSIAQKQAEIAKLRQLDTKKQTAIKSIIGGSVLAHAVKDDNFARTLISVLEKTVTKDNDLGRVNDTINNLRKKIGIAPVTFTPKAKPKTTTPAPAVAPQSSQGTNIPPRPQN